MPLEAGAGPRLTVGRAWSVHLACTRAETHLGPGTSRHWCMFRVEALAWQVPSQAV